MMKCQRRSFRRSEEKLQSTMPTVPITLVGGRFVCGLALIQQSVPHRVENIVVESDGLANDQRNRLFQCLADALATGHFADAVIGKTVFPIPKWD